MASRLTIVFIWGDVFYESPHVDGVLLPHATRIFAEKNTGNRVIFVHLIGNHTDYCLRYPPTYARYQGKLDVAIHGGLAQTKVSHQQQINCYDNSVLYNDFVVSQLLAELRKYSRIAGLVYFSDHATDVLRGKKRITGGFNYEMVSIPLVMWFSPAYREKYPHVYQSLQNNRDKLFSNDLLYDTLLGMMAIASDHYKARNDLSSPVYELNDNEALVLNGEHKYNSKDNIHWRQYRHIAALVAEGKHNRAIPAQVNNIGKLKEAWRDGSRAFALDLTYKGNCLVVGHSNMCLQDFVAHIDASEIEKLWLNAKIALGGGRNGLAEVKKYSPAATIIVDIDNCADNFKDLAKTGITLSCALSAEQLQGLTAKTAAALATQLNRQGVRAISFAGRFYPQVKTQLVPRLPSNVAMHVRSAVDIEKLKDMPYWSDAQVQTVAFRYHSRFQLPVRARQKKYAAGKIPRP